MCETCGQKGRRVDCHYAKDAKDLNDTVMSYLSTHPLNKERVDAMRAGMSKSLATLEETKCGEYMRALNRSLANRKIVPNEFSENHARVLLPSSRW